MKRKYIVIAFIFIIFISYFIIQNDNDHDPRTLSCIQNEIIPIESISPDNGNFKDLQFLKPILANKKIIILGEAGHGDGSTFLAKTRLIKYLVGELGFNAIALEGGGIYEMHTAEYNIRNNAEPKQEFYRSWFQIWSKSEQTQNLISYVSSCVKDKKLNLVGLENQPLNYYSYFLLDSIKDYLVVKHLNPFDTVSWQELTKIHYSICKVDTAYATKKRIEDYQKKIDTLIYHLSKEKSEISISNVFIRSLENLKSFNEQFLLGFFDYDSQNKGINVRDKQMFNNLDWYIQNNKNAKVIVWAANFHGAHDLNKVTYTSDTSLYNKIRVFGEYVKHKYGKNSYSIAFTSSEGYRGNIYQTDSTHIKLHDTDFEFLLSQTEFKYAFLNFSEIRNNNFCSDLKFNSQIFGNTHSGQWFSVFDGLFYIRRNYKSTPINEN